MKKFMFYAAAVAALTLVSCGGSKKSKSNHSPIAQEEETIESKTDTIPFLASLPIEGSDAEYFALENAEVILVGSAPESADHSQGTIRATVKLKIQKPYANLKGFASSPTMPLYFLNEDKELIDHNRLEMSTADKETIIAELKKDNPGVVEINYKGEFYPSSYNKIFDKTKYVQLQSARLYDTNGNSSSSSTTASASTEEEGGNDLLDRYCDAVDAYISAINNNNISKAMELAEEVQSLSIKLSKVSLSASDAAKLANYTSKASKIAAKANSIAAEAASQVSDMSGYSDYDESDEPDDYDYDF